MVINSSNETFSSDVTKSTISVVDFWAPWCGPCRVIGPILEKYDANSDNDVNIIKVNVDEYPELAGSYNIRGIPTLLFMKDGNVIGQHVGTLSEADLTSKINAYK